MNYDKILSAILMDAKLALVASSFFLAIAILITLSVLAEKILENWAARWREHRQMAAAAGNRSKAFPFISSARPNTAALKPILRV